LTGEYWGIWPTGQRLGTRLLSPLVGAAIGKKQPYLMSSLMLVPWDCCNVFFVFEWQGSNFEIRYF